MDVREYLTLEWYGNPVGSWLIALGVFVGVVGILLLLRRLVVGRFITFAGRSSNEVDDLLVDLLKRTRITVLMILTLAAIALLLLVLPGPVRTAAKVIAVVALFVQGMSWGNAIISFWVNHYAARRGMTTGSSAATVGALVVLARMVLFLVLLLFALDNLGFEIAPLIAGLGIGGIAVALAVQNILGDLFAALSIVVDKPFVVGDFIIIDTHMGTVEHIGLKTTRLRSLSGEQVIIGNADLLRARINNYQRMVERRAVFSIGVAYETRPDALGRIPVIIREAIGHQDRVRFDRSHFKGFDASALSFETVYWVLTPDYNVYMDIQQAINIELFSRFRAEGIGFAYPMRSVTLFDGGAAAGAEGSTAAQA
jgi:small-conductance mechanosensitive channel